MFPRWSTSSPSCSTMPLRSGPRKPMARSTRSASRVNSLPATSRMASRPPADNDDVLAFRRNEGLVAHDVAFATMILQRQKIHREMNPSKLAAGHRQIARDGRSGRYDDGIKVAFQFVGGDVATDVGAGF